ncbi:MAG: response regulator [Chloroflexi bacterium]|nr:response regulator [Chloroflexota bacterium]
MKVLKVLKVLLVEPDPDIARNLRALVGSMNTYQIVGNSPTGLDAMQKIPLLSPEVIILDLSLPDIQAMSVVEWVRRLLPRTQVVVISTYDLPEYRQAAARAHVAAFVFEADLLHQLTKVLHRLSQEPSLSTSERGNILLNKLSKEVTYLPAWFTLATKSRNQVPIWRLIHLVAVALSLELLAVAFLRPMEAGFLMTGWALILAALLWDLQTLRVSFQRFSHATHMTTTHKMFYADEANH